MIALFQVPYARVVVLEVFEVRADVQTHVEKKHAFGDVYDGVSGGVPGGVPGDVPGEIPGEEPVEEPAEEPAELPVEVPDVFHGGHVEIFDAAAAVVVVCGGVTEKDTDGQYVEDNAG